MKKFLEDLRKDIGDEKFSELLALEGGKTLMFAIDITGSMHNEIEAAKQSQLKSARLNAVHHQAISLRLVIR